VKIRRGRLRRQLLADLTEKRGYRKSKEALYRAVWNSLWKRLLDLSKDELRNERMNEFIYIR